MAESSPTTSSKPPPRQRRGYLTSLAVLLVGALSVVLLLLTHHLSERHTTQEFLADNVLTQVDIVVSTSHLWLEEHLSGDPSIDVEDIWHDLDHAISLVTLLQDGGRHAGGHLIEPLAETELRQQAELFGEQLAELRQLSLDRATRGGEAGSEIDQAYDEAFFDLLARSEGLRQALERRWEMHRAEARWRLGGIVTGWSMLLLVVALVMWTRERSRRHAESTLALREEELREAQKMEAVGRLAGGLAHDINNYLGAVRGYCEVAKMKGESGPALERRMDDAIDTIESVSALIRQLLAFSRRQPVKKEVVDLARLVEDLGHLMQRLIGDDVILVTRLSDDLWPIEIDPSQVEQILVNLLVNARDAMPDGGEIILQTRNLVPDAEDRLRHAVAPGRYVLLSMADSGRGMSAEVREKLFEPFFTTKSDGHSGLGLATVYGIVRQNGGTIVVESEPDRGTSFKILLPACDGEPAAAVTAPSPTATRPHLTARVLLVEDNAAVRRSTRDMLEALGHETRVVAGGPEALQLLVDEGMEVDLVITDVLMPGMSGRELVDRLRAARPATRCLFLSGHTDRVRLQHGLSEERVDFLAKPFGAEDLQRKIEEILEAG